MKNQVILCTEENKGAPLKEYWESRGVNTSGVGCDVVGIYFGVIHGYFSVWYNSDIREHNPEIIELPKPYPKVMEVWDYEGDFPRKRVVFMEKNGKYLAWSAVETLEAAEKETVVWTWDFARDIPEKTVKRMTLEEIAKELGVDEVEVVDKSEG